MSDERVTYRGVRWRRDDEGRISWRDDERKVWVRWRRGADAPPLPPDWGGQAAAARPAATGGARAGWRSPYRWVPILLGVFIIVIALVQTLRPSSHQTSDEAAASAKLAGQCLRQNGTANGHPKYSATPVPCGSPTAAVKVVKVVPTTPGSPACPDGTTWMTLGYAGVAHPHLLCIQALPGRGLLK